MDENNEEEVQVVRPLRSIESLQDAYVLFVNDTNRLLMICWINFTGVETKYSTVKPQSRTPVNTFLTHPWVFRDRLSAERMYVNRSNIFLPEEYFIPDEQQPGRFLPCRKRIYIHVPVRTLREKCLYYVLKHILIKSLEKESSGPAAWKLAKISIESLPIPVTLVQQLVSMHQFAESWHQSRVYNRIAS